MNPLRSAFLVSLILQALRLTLASTPPVVLPLVADPMSTIAPRVEEETDCSYDLPEDGSATALEIRRALNCWKSLGRPGDMFCPSGYGRFFNDSECWNRIYRFEITPAPIPIPTAYPAPYP